MESAEIRVMRTTCWERAKGELRAMGHTFWGNEEQYNKLQAEISKFILTVEDNGLHE